MKKYLICSILSYALFSLNIANATLLSGDFRTEVYLPTSLSSIEPLVYENLGGR